MKRSVLVTGLMLVVFLPRLSAQEGLTRAVERAREAFFGHQVGTLLATSDTVRLNIPGTAKSASMKPGQAARILEKYLHSAQERDLTVVRLRTLAEDHAYAELDRSYVVRGTSEERRERVILGFRRVEGTWRLREVRVTP